MKQAKPSLKLSTADKSKKHVIFSFDIYGSLKIVNVHVWAKISSS